MKLPFEDFGFLLSGFLIFQFGEQCIYMVSVFAMSIAE